MNFFGVILGFLLISLSANALEWPQDMTGALTEQECASAFPNGRYVEAPLDGTTQENFKLFYFSVNPIDPKRPTFLYIDGGPGQATGAGPNTLRFTNLKNINVVYFHPRGVGCSTLPADTKYDAAISTETNSHDIERIKNHIGLNQWSVIFGVSYGTVSGLNYAELYPNSVQKLVFEGLFNPSHPRDKVSIALTKGLPTLLQVLLTWPEYSTVPSKSADFIREQTLALFQTGKMVNSKGVELNEAQINSHIVNLYSSTYQGVYSTGSLNKNSVYSAANRLLKLFYTVEELPSLPSVQYEFANQLPYQSLRVYVNTSLRDSLELEFIEALTDPTKMLSNVVNEFYQVSPYLKANNSKEYKLIQLPKRLATHIQMTLLLGTEDGITTYEGAVEYLKALQSPYKLYGLKGFGHQRHFDDACYAKIIEQLFVDQNLEGLFADQASSCYLPEGHLAE